MTRINGKGPKPPMRLVLERLERSPDYTAALFEVIGGAQDGGRLALAITHPGGVPQLAVQTLLGGAGQVLAEGVIAPRQAMDLLPTCTCGAECRACAERDPRDRPDHGHLAPAMCAVHAGEAP